MKPISLSESSLYVDDLDRAENFYRRVLGLNPIRGNDRFRAMSVADSQVLLLFLRGASLDPVEMPGGTLPAHDGHGPLHVCLGIPSDTVDAWSAQLEAQGVPVESRINWPSGACSLYFRDPDGNAIELATQGIWEEGFAQKATVDPAREECSLFDGSEGCEA
ncbi:MAG: VOC family protein [Terrimicrobiaceae bacterium]